MAKKKAAKKKTTRKKTTRKSAIKKTPRNQALPGIGDDKVNEELEGYALDHEEAKDAMRVAKENIKKVMHRRKMAIYRRGRFRVNMKQGAETVSVSVKPEAVDPPDAPNDDEVPF